MKKIFTVLIFLTTLVGLANAQKTIEGVVKDFDGVPLPGVNVTIKGTTTGTITDLDGKYTIENVPQGSTLTYSFMGMLTEEMLIENQTNVDITLVEDLMSLEEVVVVGYGETKRANLTGSVTDMTTEEIADIPTSDLTSLLDGRLSGVKIETTTGLPGSTSTIQIRGNSSFGATESPLYVIDGIADTDGTLFNSLDPTEIASISVLKDASAAVYGARAAGGVILVTTKKGKEGKPQINYSGSYGISNATQLPEMLSAYDQAEMLNYINANAPKSYTGATKYDTYTDDELEAFKDMDYSYLDDLWKNASNTRHTLNVSGGSENVHYFLSGSYYNEKGNIKGYNTDRYSFRSNIDAKITTNLTAKVNISASAKEREYPYYSGEEQSGVARSFFTKILTTPKWIPGEIDGLPVGNQYDTWQPYGLLQSGSYKNSRSFNTNLQGELEYQVPMVKGLSVGVSYNYSISNGKGKSYLQSYDLYYFETEGDYNHIITDELTSSTTTLNNEESIYLSSDLSTGYQLDAYVAYSKTFGLHNISAKFVYEQIEDESSDFTAYRKGAITQGVDQLWAYDADTEENTAGEEESGRLSYVGRLNYRYNDKYLLEGTFRYEASSFFNPDYAWGFFPSGSAGWIVSEENFFKDNISFINFMKIRGSVGLLGNDATSSNQWAVSYTGDVTGPIFGNKLTNAIDTQNDALSTPTLTWQKTRFYDIGADWRFLNNQIDFAVDWYYKYTFDILAKRQAYLPMSVGILSSPKENYGEMYATGFEIEATYHGKIGSDLKYDVGGHFSWDKRMKVVVDQSDAAIGRWDDQTKNAPDNQPGYICLGMIRTDEDLEMVKEMMYYDGTIDGDTLAKGMLYYKDIRGEDYSDGPDGKIDENDMTTIAKHTTAPYHYSVNLGASWKGIDVGILFTGKFGHKAFVEKDEMTLPDASTNVFTWWNDYWTPENTDAAMPRPYQYGLEAQKSTFWMRNGNTLRLKSLNVGYTPPSNFLTQHNLPKFRVYFSANNLWTIISPFDYKDPSVSRAYDYPMTRTYNFGVNLTL